MQEGALALPQGFVSNSSLYPTLYRGTFRASHQGLQANADPTRKPRLVEAMRFRSPYLRGYLDLKIGFPSPRCALTTHLTLTLPLTLPLTHNAYPRPQP